MVTADGKVRVVNHVAGARALLGAEGRRRRHVRRGHPADARHPPAARRTSAPSTSRSTPSPTTPSGACSRGSSSWLRANLINPHWGEQVRAGLDNRLSISMVFQGMTQAEARAAFQPLVDFANANPADYEGQNAVHRHRPAGPQVLGRDVHEAGPGRDPSRIRGRAPRRATSGGPATPTRSAPSGMRTRRPGCRRRCWRPRTRPGWSTPGSPPAATGSSHSTSTRAWPARRPRRSPPARDTPINPDVLNAFALAIIAADGRLAVHGLPQPNLTAARS